MAKSKWDILKVLADGQYRSGNTINKEIEPDVIKRLGAATLYRFIQELLSDDFIYEVPPLSLTEPERLYYGISHKGLQEAERRGLWPDVKEASG